MGVPRVLPALLILTLAHAPTWDLTPVPLEVPAVSVRVREVVPLERVTYYHAVQGQTDRDPHTSACGPNRSDQIAVSRDLFRRVLDCGDAVTLWVGGVGPLDVVVWDTLHPRFSSTADLLVPVGEHPSFGRAVGYLVIGDL